LFGFVSDHISLEAFHMSCIDIVLETGQRNG
jgi:hypothetical protein